ncbi:hypothetical protein [Streptomyces anulatus]|uniref:hypothetical protein n=1 Tax=Streptomyces anulatus TaxID=1892 RepID=UPI0032540561
MGLLTVETHHDVRVSTMTANEARTRDLQEQHRLVGLLVDGQAPQLMRDHNTKSLTATAISALDDRKDHSQSPGRIAGGAIGRGRHNGLTPSSGTTPPFPVHPPA